MSTQHQHPNQPSQPATDRTGSALAESGTLRCGNCGAAVARSDITCPRCGALLAAYQAPTGASTGTLAATQPVSYLTEVTTTPVQPEVAEPPSTPEATTTSSTAGIPPPTSGTTPPSSSPIADALDRSRGMSTGSASGVDAAAELANMAKDDSRLARDVEAELAGARVTFDGATPTIETASTAAGAPSAAPQTAPSAPRPHRSADRTGRAAARGAATLPADPTPLAHGSSETPHWTEQWTLDAMLDNPPWQRYPRIKRWLAYVPFVAIFLVMVMGFGEFMALAGVLVGLVAGVGFLYFLIAASRTTSRKTTQMPRDDHLWNEQKRRR